MGAEWQVPTNALLLFVLRIALFACAVLFHLTVYFGRRAPLARTFSPTVTAGAPHGRETVVSPPLLPAESVARIKFLRLNGNDQTGMQRVAAYGNVTGHVHEGL